MSKADISAVVDLSIDFIVQNVSDTLQCHYDDGWGPSASDPKGQEGLQDCLLARYQLCAMHGGDSSTPAWFDFTACLFRNQKETDTITDNMAKFNSTIAYCSGMTAGAHLNKLEACAQGDEGQALLLASHNRERAGNVHRDSKGHDHPDWIIVNGVDLQGNETADWLGAVCAAVKQQGGTMPASCMTV